MLFGAAAGDHRDYDGGDRELDLNLHEERDLITTVVVPVERSTAHSARVGCSTISG
jgi:hypothetical protein